MQDAGVERSQLEAVLVHARHRFVAVLARQFLEGRHALNNFGELAELVHVDERRERDRRRKRREVEKGGRVLERDEGSVRGDVGRRRRIRRIEERRQVGILRQIVQDDAWVQRRSGGKVSHLDCEVKPCTRQTRLTEEGNTALHSVSGTSQWLCSTSEVVIGDKRAHQRAHMLELREKEADVRSLA